jgi:hypothetical protein
MRKRKIFSTIEILREDGVPMPLIIIFCLVFMAIGFVIGVGIWVLIAALPIWIGTFIFPYTFKWTYALFAGVCLTIIHMVICPSSTDTED